MSYRNLKAEMRRDGVTQRMIAEFLGMSVNNLCLKLNEKVPMTVDEAKSVQDEFFPNASLDYLLESDGDVPDARERIQASVEDLREAMQDAGVLGEEAERLLSMMGEATGRACGEGRQEAR